MERDNESQDVDREHERVHGRVSRVEAALEGLQRDNARMEQKFDSQFGELNTKLDRLASGQLAASRTNWSALAGWMSVLVIVVGAIGVAYVRPLEVRDAQHDQQLAEARHDSREAVIKNAVLEERLTWVRWVAEKGLAK